MTAASFAFFGMLFWEESKALGGALLVLAVFRTWALFGEARRLGKN